MESPDQILKKRRLDHVKEALEMIKSKVAYRVLTEENRDVIEAKPADWTREHQERLISLAKATADFNYHFRFGIVEDKWYPLTQLISIKKGKTFYFPKNTYEVHALTGRFRSLLKKGNSKNWGAGEGEDIEVRCIDGVVKKKKHFKKRTSSSRRSGRTNPWITSTTSTETTFTIIPSSTWITSPTQ